MTQDDILLVCGLAGLAVVITLFDLLLSFVRHRRSARVRAFKDRLQVAVKEETDVAPRTDWINRRLTAIEKASSDAPSQPPAPNPM